MSEINTLPFIKMTEKDLSTCPRCGNRMPDTYPRYMSIEKSCQECGLKFDIILKLDRIVASTRDY